MDNKVTRLKIQSLAIVLFIAMFTPHPAFSSQDENRMITLDGVGSIVGFSRNSKTLISHSGRTIYISNVDNGELIATFGRDLDRIDSYGRGLVISPNGESVTSYNTQNIDLWNLVFVKKHDRSLKRKLMTALQGDEGGKLTATLSGKLVATLKGFEDDIASVAYSSNGRVVVSVTKDGVIKRWNVSNGVLINSHETNKGSDIITKVSFSSDGELLAMFYEPSMGYKEGWLKIWNVDDGELNSTYEDSGSVSFSPNGEIIALAGNDSIKLWNVGDRQLINTLKVKGGFFTFSPDSTALAVFRYDSDRTIQLWDVEDGKLVTILEGRINGLVDAIEFSADGMSVAASTTSVDIDDSNVRSSIATAPIKRTARLWNVENGKLITSFDGGLGGLIVFSPDGKTLAIDNAGAPIKLWDLKLVDERLASNAYRLIDKQDMVALKKYYNKVKNTKLQTVQRTVNDIVDLAKSRSSINDYQWLIRNITGQAIAETAFKNLYAIIERKNTVKDYQWFIAEHPNQPLTENAIQGIYEIVSKKNTVNDYQWFLANYPNHALSQNAIKGIYTIVQNNNTLNDYRWFSEHYQRHQLAEEALKSAYKLVNNENNILGYAWFSDKFSRYPIGTIVLRDLHELAYGIAKDENTIEAWNDYIIAYPYANQINEALKKSYALEEEKYSGWFSSDEKNSRALRVKMKQLEMKMEDISDTILHSGYLLILNRMSQLLQEKFPAEEATLDYIESDNYATLRRHYKSTLEEIRQTTKRIAVDKGDIAPLMKELGKTVHAYFSTSAQSDAMAQLYAQQYEQWEQYLDKHELRSFENLH